jgi:hypothetical protein
MISRLTFFAAVFAAIATVSLAYAAESPSNASLRRPVPPPRGSRDRGHAHGRVEAGRRSR